MKVYVITKGKYSDYRICAVTTDKEKAEMLKEKFNHKFEPANVEEFDTDTGEELLRYKNLYQCYYHLDSKAITTRQNNWNWFDAEDLYPHPLIGGDRIYVIVNADDEEMALKKASDKFAKYIAEKEGL